jgi:hypothetical protein
MEYSQPIKIPDGRYYLKVSKGGERVFYQLNKLKLVDETLLAAKNLSFQLNEMSQSIVASVEQDLINQAVASKLDWFGKEIADETIQKAYQSALEGTIFQAPLATVKGDVVTVAYDTQKNGVELGSIQKDATLDVLVELSGLWFLKKSCGPIFRIAQIRVSSAPVQKKTFPTEYLFDDAPQDEAEEDSPADYLD